MLSVDESVYGARVRHAKGVGDVLIGMAFSTQPPHLSDFGHGVLALAHNRWRIVGDQVCPIFIANDLADQALRNAKGAPERFLGLAVSSKTAPDGMDLIIGQHDRVVRYPRQPRLSVSGGHVAHVVGVRSEQKVSGIATSFHVARMTHDQPIGDGSVRQFPRNVMGTTLSIADTEGSIAVREASRQPQPAIVRIATINLYPKSGANIKTHRRVNSFGVSPRPSQAVLGHFVVCNSTSL